MYHFTSKDFDPLNVLNPVGHIFGISKLVLSVLALLTWQKSEEDTRAGILARKIPRTSSSSNQHLDFEQKNNIKDVFSSFALSKLHQEYFDFGFWLYRRWWDVLDVSTVQTLAGHQMFCPSNAQCWYGQFSPPFVATYQSCNAKL